MADELIQQIYEIGKLIHEDHYEDPHGIALHFHPERSRTRRGRVMGGSGDFDAWSAMWGTSHRGTGASLEMALLELQASMKKKLKEMAEEEEARADKAKARAEAIRDKAGLSSPVMGKPAPSGTPQEPPA